MCHCNLSAETTKHFLVECNLFAEFRDVLFLEIHHILAPNGLLNLENNLKTKLLLYGCDILSDDDNNAVLKATINFIHNSKRFESIDE